MFGVRSGRLRRRGTMVVVWAYANAEEGFMLEGRRCVKALAACFTAFHFTAILSCFFWDPFTCV